MLSGTVIGLFCVFSLLIAALLMALLNRREKGKGNLEKSRFLSRFALGLFLAAFVGGVVVTLVAGLRPRSEEGGKGGMGGGGGAIGAVDQQELDSLKKKVQENPGDLDSRERLGHLYLQMQDFQNVFQMAHEALQLNPKGVESRAHMGMVLFAMQDYDQALKQFDQALAINPKHLETLLYKGIVQFQGLQDLAGAKQTWGRYLKIAKPTDSGYERVKMFYGMIDEDLIPK